MQNRIEELHDELENHNVDTNKIDAPICVINLKVFLFFYHDTYFRI